MKRLIIVLTMLIAGCYGKPEKTQQVNAEFAIETLFTQDGCTVYRFQDGGKRYFTNCRGSAQWSEGCGKGCMKNVEVLGVPQ